MSENNALFQKTFTIYQYHLDFLEEQDENASNALRKELDGLINAKNKNKKKENYDNVFNFMGFGMILFLLSFVLVEPPAKIASVAIGAFLFGYGAIGGIKNILQQARR